MNDQTYLRTEVGTREYLAPEVLGYVDEENTQYTNAVDVWSLGCICYRLLTLERPFSKMTALAPYCWGKKELPIDALHKATVSNEGVAFIKNLMAPQPSDRMSAATALESSWLKDVDNLESNPFPQNVEKPIHDHNKTNHEQVKPLPTSTVRMDDDRDHKSDSRNEENQDLGFYSKEAVMERLVLDPRLETQLGTSEELLVSLIECRCMIQAEIRIF